MNRLPSIERLQGMFDDPKEWPALAKIAIPRPRYFWNALFELDNRSFRFAAHLFSFATQIKDVSVKPWKSRALELAIERAEQQADFNWVLRIAPLEKGFFDAALKQLAKSKVNLAQVISAVYRDLNTGHAEDDEDTIKRSKLFSFLSDEKIFSRIDTSKLSPELRHELTVRKGPSEKAKED